MGSKRQRDRAFEALYGVKPAAHTAVPLRNAAHEHNMRVRNATAAIYGTIGSLAFLRGGKQPIKPRWQEHLVEGDEP